MSVGLIFYRIFGVIVYKKTDAFETIFIFKNLYFHHKVMNNIYLNI